MEKKHKGGKSANGQGVGSPGYPGRGEKRGNARDQMIPPLLLEHKMHMRRPPGMAMQLLQQLADRPIVRNRITNGPDGLEPKGTFLIRLHDRSAVGRVALGALHVIVPRRIRLPDVDFHAGDGVSGRVSDGAEDETGRSGGVGGDVLPGGDGRGVVGVEGPEDGAFGGAWGLGVVDGVDEEGEAEDVGEENEFLLRFVSCRI
jgi:hypothetical protein